MNTKNILIVIFILNITVYANWQYKSSMPIGRVGAVAVEYNEKIYIIGGKDSQNNYLTRVDLYDPVTDTWDTSSVASIQNERINATALVYNDSIFVIGGKDDSEVLKSVEVYLPTQNMWIEVHDLRREREAAFSVYFNDRPFVFGGADDNGYLEEEVEWWDKSSSEWRESTIEFNPSRASVFNFVRSDTLYIFGGFYFGPLSTSLKLASDGSWSDGINLSQPRGNGTTALIGNHVFFIGGETNSGVTDLVEMYNVTRNTISTIQSMPYARATHMTAVHNDVIYVFGGHGSNPSNVFSSVIAFDASLTSIDDNLPDLIPTENKLFQNYPNPFNGSTTIEFELAKASLINLSVYDTKGQKIKEIINEFVNSGLHKIKWNGLNEFNTKVSSGTYLIILKSEKNIQNRKILYLK